MRHKKDGWDRFCIVMIWDWDSVWLVCFYPFYRFLFMIVFVLLSFEWYYLSTECSISGRLVAFLIKFVDCFFLHWFSFFIEATLILNLFLFWRVIGVAFFVRFFLLIFNSSIWQKKNFMCHTVFTTIHNRNTYASHFAWNGWWNEIIIQWLALEIIVYMSVHISFGIVVAHFMLTPFFLLLIIDMAGLFVAVVACILSNMHFNFFLLLIVILTRFYWIDLFYISNHDWVIHFVSLFCVCIFLVSVFIFTVTIFFIWFLRPEFSSLLRQYNARVNMN